MFGSNSHPMMAPCFRGSKPGQICAELSRKTECVQGGKKETITPLINQFFNELDECVSRSNGGHLPLAQQGNRTRCAQPSSETHCCACGGRHRMSDPVRANEPGSCEGPADSTCIGVHLSVTPPHTHTCVPIPLCTCTLKR